MKHKQRTYNDPRIQDIVKKSRYCTDTLLVHLFGYGTPNHDPYKLFSNRKDLTEAQIGQIKIITEDQYRILSDFLKLCRLKTFSMHEQKLWSASHQKEFRQKNAELSIEEFTKWREDSVYSHLIKKFKDYLEYEQQEMVKLGLKKKESVTTVTQNDAEEAYDFSLKKLQSIKAGRGVGKTFIQAIIDLSFFILYPNSKVFILGPVGQQVQESLWAEMSTIIRDSTRVYGASSVFYGADIERRNLDHKHMKMISKTSKRIFFEAEGKDWFISTVSIDRSRSIQDQVEQISGKHNDYMLISFEEASNIADHIYDTISNSCKNSQVNLMTCAFNPNRKTGFAIEACQGENATPSRKYSGVALGYRINPESCPLISPEDLREAAARYGGRESNEYRIAFLGLEPIHGETSTFFSSACLDDAYLGYIENIDKIDESSVTRTISIDLAAEGADRLVMAYWCGNFLVEIEEVDKAKMSDDGQLLRGVAEYAYNKKADRIIYESNGIGAFVKQPLQSHLSAFNENSPYLFEPKLFPVTLNHAAKGSDHKKYGSKGDQMYGRFRASLEARNVYINPIGTLDNQQIRKQYPMGDMNELKKQRDRFKLLEKQMLLAEVKTASENVATRTGGSVTGKLIMRSFKANASLNKKLKESTNMKSPDHLDAVKLFFSFHINTVAGNTFGNMNYTPCTKRTTRFGSSWQTPITGNIGMC